jgi:hypothetical protein
MPKPPEANTSALQIALDGLRAADPDSTVSWCSSCLRVAVTTPKPERKFTLLWPGEEGCRQVMECGKPANAIKSLEERDV